MENSDSSSWLVFVNKKKKRKEERSMKVGRWEGESEGSEWAVYSCGSHSHTPMQAVYSCSVPATLVLLSMLSSSLVMVVKFGLRLLRTRWRVSHPCLAMSCRLELKIYKWFEKKYRRRKRSMKTVRWKGKAKGDTTIGLFSHFLTAHFPLLVMLPLALPTRTLLLLCSFFLVPTQSI